MEKMSIEDTVIEIFPLPCLCVDEHGIIIELNDAAEKMIGLSKEVLKGKSHFEILHGTQAKEACPLFTHSTNGDQAFEVESLLRKDDGEIITISSIGSPLYEEGRFIGGFEFFRDVSALKKLERERKSFLSMIAHDMKHPVIVTLGFLSRLLEEKGGNLTESQKTYLEIIRDEQNRLERLINDFVELSKLEISENKPVYEPFSMEKFLHDKIKAERSESDKKHIEISFEYPNTLPIINADTAMINRVITNLLDNALKYTNPGGTITVNLVDRKEDILIQITDTGIGIPEEHLPHIFDPFYRVNPDLPGSGLGLSIVKKIIEAHGGKIWVESKPCKGSTFSFTLPKRPFTAHENKKWNSYGKKDR